MHTERGGKRVVERVREKLGLPRKQVRVQLAEPPARSRSPINRRDDIDGIRAIAVVLVVLHHAFPEAVPGGFVGVDIFFVISGYLITGIVAATIIDGSFSIGWFLERRVRRLLPALTVVGIATSVAAAVLMLPAHFKVFFKSAFAATFFAANFFFAAQTDYFAPNPQVHFLLHTWSLAVEEQFYLAFPLLMIFLGKIGRRPFPVLIALGLLSFSYSSWQVATDAVSAYYLPFGRAWELLIGSALALAPHSDRYRNLVGIGGLAAIAVAAFTYSRTTAFPGGAALVPCAGAAALIYARHSVVSSALSVRPIVYVGLISYSLYLWHWPILAALRYATANPPELYIFGAIALSFFAAVLCYHFVEKPFRVESKVPPRFLWRSAFAATCLAAVVSFALARGSGWPSRFPVMISQISGRELYNEGTCFLRRTQSVSDWQGSGCFITAGFTDNALLWGDSFAAHLVPGFVVNANEVGFNLLQYTLSSCPPQWNDGRSQLCNDFNDDVEAIIRRYAIKTVFLAARWEFHFDRKHTTLQDIGDSIARLERLGLNVVVIGQTPMFRFSDPRQHMIRSMESLGTEFKASRTDSVNAILAGLGPTFIDPSAGVCADECPVFKAGNFYVWDNGHLSTYGSVQYVKQIVGNLGSRYLATASTTR